MRFIGCKTKLLSNIDAAIEEFCPDAEQVCDIFSGTATVARHLKPKFEVTSNDLLYFSYVLQVATIENDEIPSFDKLASIGINSPIDYLNSINTEDMEQLDRKYRLFQNNFSPLGNRQYFTEENALRIDFARNTLNIWKSKELVTRLEYFYILSCIIEGIPYVSNTSGTYGAFNKFWDKRSFKKYELFKLPVTHNGKKNKCFNEDGVNLLKRIKGDLLYVDPPYNNRQYLPNYHVLETAAMYDFVEFHGITGQRKDENKKSEFCQKRKVINAFGSLVKNANYKHILLSYNTEGLMTTDQIQEIMTTYGKKESFKIIEIPYRRFKSRATKHNGEVKELLIHIEKDI